MFLVNDYQKLEKINETKNNQINVENKFNKLVENMINEIIFDQKKLTMFLR